MRVFLDMVTLILFLILCAPVAGAQPVFMAQTGGLIASAPETFINDAPARQSNKTEAVFKFSVSGGEGFGGFECSADSVAYRGCLSPYTRSALIDGQYVFCVRGVDANGVKDDSPACHEWVVDTKPPEVKITEPSDGSGVFTRDPTIKGTSSEPFCVVRVFVGDKDAGNVTSDANGHWAFSAPLGLTYGQPTLGAVATDQAGNVSRRVTISVKVSPEPPKTEIVEHPEQVSRSHNAVFEFASPSGATEFECQLDNATGFTPCDEVWLLKKLAVGPHTLRVRAKDIAGNVDQAPPEYTWTVDPQAAITCSPDPQGGCASSGGRPTLVLSLLGGLLLVLTSRRRRSS